MGLTLWVPFGIFMLGLVAAALYAIDVPPVADVVALGAVVAVPIAAFNTLELNGTQRNLIIVVVALTAALYGVFRFDPFGMTRDYYGHRMT